MDKNTSKIIEINSGPDYIFHKNIKPTKNIANLIAMEVKHILDKRILKPVEFPEFKLTLRPSQQQVFDEVNDNSIINAWVSWGKTFTGLAIAGKLGQKTLIVTHTLPLRKQWENEIEKVFGFTHNDLHTNNVMYYKTEIEYLEYKIEDKYYKVPTFGKIYKIRRAILRANLHTNFE